MDRPETPPSRTVWCLAYLAHVAGSNVRLAEASNKWSAPPKQRPPPRSLQPIGGEPFFFLEVPLAATGALPPQRGPISARTVVSDGDSRIADKPNDPFPETATNVASWASSPTLWLMEKPSYDECSR
jgi:hypothetical protein